MHVSREEGARPIKAWLGLKEAPSDDLNWGDRSGAAVLDIEAAALQQTKNIARLPFIAPQGVALMPDAHLGKGATVGSVVPTTHAIIPSAVGVDLGCGMNAVRLSLKASDLPESLKAVRDMIEANVPLGKGGQHEEFPRYYFGPRGSKFLESGVVPDSVAVVFGDTKGGSHNKAAFKAGGQLGSLGSGNHFIELCIDENQDVWVMVHSGSRGIGNMIGSYYIERAKKLMEMFYITLPDGDQHPGSYTEDGVAYQYDTYGLQGNDIVNAPEVKKMWVNVYKDIAPESVHGYGYSAKESANDSANHKSLLATVRLEFSPNMVEVKAFLE